MFRRGEYHIGDRQRLLQPITKLHDMALFDQRFIFERNEIVNQRREFYAVAPFRFGDVLDVMRHTPAGAERDDDVAGTNELLETMPPRPHSAEHADEIAQRGLEDRHEEPRIAHD